MKRLICLIVMIVLMTAAASAEMTQLTVRGTGVVNMTADCAKVILGVQETAQDVLEAQGSVNAKINTIVEALIASGVSSKDIGTESMHIFANYDYSEGQRLTGYTASNTISISSEDLEVVGKYIDIAFANGANTLENVSFSAKDSSEAQKEALQLAVENAYEKAEVIAAAAGMQIDGVEMIDETGEYYGSVEGAKYSNIRMESAVAGQSTLVQAGTLRVSANIVMKFQLSEVES